MPRHIPSLANLPTLGPGDKIGEGDSYILHDLLRAAEPDDPTDPSSIPFADTVFARLRDEVAWQTMRHAAGAVPRLVAVQGALDAAGGGGSSKPVYRHPADQSPPLTAFSPTVLRVRAAAERAVGCELNHVLIQLYRDGGDHITEHADKTLDIRRGTVIVNASFGARRTMRLRRKRGEGEEAGGGGGGDNAAEKGSAAGRETQRVHMPHNSLFVLGPATNRRWLHGIPPDKRLPAERAPEELAFGGARISLTFRSVATFLDGAEERIWGQGAVGKTRELAGRVVVGDEGETERMIRAFGRENREDEGWDWDAVYGDGFDVLHFQDG
jgi:alkylated DNA repair dioxygenase AlkB